MAEVVAISVVNFSVNTNPYLDSYPVGAIQKFKKNRNRRLRRQRNRLKYVAKLRQLRIRRRTEQLCAAVSIFDISDMENATQNYISHPPKEVTEWQYNHQLAYWKSRAVSLEYENHMLKQHIKSYYIQQIENHNKCIQDEKLDTSQDDINTTTSQSEVEADNKGHEQKTDRDNELYGCMAPKINGMETAMQVSYNLQVDRSNPPYWPNLPLNL